jgi:hypothetical protein
MIVRLGFVCVDELLRLLMAMMVLEPLVLVTYEWILDVVELDDGSCITLSCRMITARVESMVEPVVLILLLLLLLLLLLAVTTFDIRSGIESSSSL